MANMNIEDYIKDMNLSPELAEKARQCKTAEKFSEFVSENDIELPLDALASVAGGVGFDPPDYNVGDKVYRSGCPTCQGYYSTHKAPLYFVEAVRIKSKYYIHARCNECGALWKHVTLPSGVAYGVDWDKA